MFVADELLQLLGHYELARDALLEQVENKGPVRKQLSAFNHLAAHLRRMIEDEGEDNLFMEQARPRVRRILERNDNDPVLKSIAERPKRETLPA